MRFAKAAERSGTRGRPWPRVVGAVALAVLGACGVVVLVAPARSKAPPSLASHSNWALARALPAGRDFPADWGYGVSGPLRRSPIPDTVVSSTPPPGVPRAVYAPAACTKIPTMLDHAGASMGPIMSVDRYTELQVNPTAFMDSEATGEIDEVGPRAGITIWVAPDGPARIANYVDWLGHCDSYHVTNYDGNGRLKNERTVKTVVEARSAAGANAALTVTRSFTVIGNPARSATYHVGYYALRGVILECHIFMDGPDRDLVQKRAAQTLQRLGAL
jgi:hypothetical protein